MTQSFVDALQFALSKTGLSVREIAKRSEVPYERLRQVARGRTASTNADDAYRIARAFGVSYEEFLNGMLDEPQRVAIAGRVGAGAQVPVFDAYEKGDGPQVETPPGLPSTGIVAVEIEGDSMEPTFFAGDLLFYTRHTAEGVPSEALGRICVCEDADGMGWVKQVKLGTEPGRHHLIAINPQADNMHNAALKWAAPVRLHWPAELARKI